MQQVICGLAGVVVAHQEGEGGPDCIEHSLDVPADIDQQEAPRNPAAADPPSMRVPCVHTITTHLVRLLESANALSGSSAQLMPATGSHGDILIRAQCVSGYKVCKSRTYALKQ